MLLKKQSTAKHGTFELSLHKMFIICIILYGPLLLLFCVILASLLLMWIKNMHFIAQWLCNVTFFVVTSYISISVKLFVFCYSTWHAFCTFVSASPVSRSSAALQKQNYDIKSSTDMATATVKHMSQNQCKDIEYFLVTYVMLCSGMKY